MKNWLHGEPRLDEVLTDPIILAILFRDGIDPERLRRSLVEQARRVRGASVMQHA